MFRVHGHLERKRKEGGREEGEGNCILHNPGSGYCASIPYDPAQTTTFFPSSSLSTSSCHHPFQMFFSIYVPSLVTLSNADTDITTIVCGYLARSEPSQNAICPSEPTLDATHPHPLTCRTSRLTSANWRTPGCWFGRLPTVGRPKIALWH